MLAALARQSLPGSVDDEFRLPDFAAPFDLEAHLSRVPPYATVKGMFISDLARVCKDMGEPVPEGRYVAFRDYPLIDYMRAVVDVARTAYPGSPLPDAIRQLGQRGFEVLANSLTGKVLFAFAGRDLGAVLGLVSEAYKRSLNPVGARVGSIQPGRAVIELRDVWNFSESYQVGVFEGALRHYGHSGTVKIKRLSPCDTDYLLEWA